MKLTFAQRIAVGFCSLAVWGFGMFLSLACAPTWISVPEGVLVTEGATIETEDNAWPAITPGRRFVPPFYSNECPERPTTTNYTDGERLGARRVRIRYPGLAYPLYGLLSLCKVYPDFNGAAARSYQLDVPQNYVNSTDGGRISVVYEEYTWNPATAGKIPAWILWISRAPFPMP